MTRRAGLLAVVLAAALAGGCASVPPAAAPTAKTAAPSKADPWEAMNRKVFAFNDAVDQAVLIPVARAYRDVVPEPLRQAFDNVLGNVTDGWAVVNHLLQGKPKDALDTGMRVGVNSLFGLLGVLDVASEMGFERQNEDFGQTLGRWGFGPGPYLVVPFLGPRSLRDALAYPADRVTSFASLAGEGANVYTMTALELIHTRAGLLASGRLLNQIALDRYSFVRDSYLAKRRNDVYDGNPPEVPDDEPPERAPVRR
jgi:phospholipid-binding lipoprotein MlaA